MRKSENLFAKHLLPMLISLAIVFGTNHKLLGQVSEGGVPYSFSNLMPGNIHTVTMPPVDRATLLAEDEAEARQGVPVPFRFGFPFDVDLGLDNAGTWTELLNGDRIWRLKIIAPGAFSINLLYDDFWLPDGAKLFIYNADHSMLIGAFTAANNKEHGKFSTAPVKGNISILEYYEPAFVQKGGRLHISRVVHAYRNLFGASGTGTLNKIQGFGDSGSCNINVNCPQGAPWADEKRAVVMILTSGGSRICSGAMINNVEQDLTPYLLTANHCLGGEATWIIMYNYESPNCSDIDGPTDQTVSGTTLKANNSASDFALLRLSATPPRSYDVRYAGWSRSTNAPSSSVGIHHPSGDIKKISFDNDTAVSDRYKGTSGVANSHWKVIWNDGTTEGGSSGSPLFDPNHRIVGQLHGGYASCSNQNGADWYGKFSMSWSYGSSSSTRLKDWLDPNNTGVTTLSGMNDQRPYPPTNVYITGYVGGLPTVHWTASPSSVSYYQVYRRRTANYPGPWSVIATTTGTSWIDSQITIETSGNADDYYAYKVTAMGTNGWESESSNQVGTYGKAFCPLCKIGSPGNTEMALPETYSLGPNYPNPFNPTTTIRYELPEDSFTELRIYDLLGREVRTLINGNQVAGYKSVQWNGKDSSGNPVSSGMYVYHISARSRESNLQFSQTRKMILLR